MTEIHYREQWIGERTGGDGEGECRDAGSVRRVPLVDQGARCDSERDPDII